MNWRQKKPYSWTQRTWKPHPRQKIDLIRATLNFFKIFATVLNSPNKIIFLSIADTVINYQQTWQSYLRWSTFLFWYISALRNWEVLSWEKLRLLFWKFFLTDSYSVWWGLFINIIFFEIGQCFQNASKLRTNAIELLSYIVDRTCQFFAWV